MEKRNAHYDLEAVKAIVLERGIDAFTETALRGLDVMGLSERWTVDRAWLATRDAV